MSGLDILVFAFLLALGYGVGQYLERRHYRSIARREEALRGLLVIQTRFPPAAFAERTTSVLVTGSVVISVDYFKAFVAGMRTLVGGRLRSYESLIDRARREAVLRMKEQARSRGATAIMNVKFQDAPLYKGQYNTVQAVEVMAYGTALVPARDG